MITVKAQPATPEPHAFTLIELLVVITIIVVLFALLVPALDKAMESALRAQCAANLHAFGLAVPQYAMGHRRRLLSTVRHKGAYIYPNLAWGDNNINNLLNDTKSVERWAQWSAHAMQEYTPGVDVARRVYDGIWYCPSNRQPVRHTANKATVESTEGGWFAPDYAYFARADMWGELYTTRPQELTGRQLKSGKLLMADALYFFAPGGGMTWWWNHGPEGPSVHNGGWGSPVRSGVPALSGTNQLFGDGSAAWKEEARFDPQAMFERAVDQGYVSSNAGPNPNGNLNFW